MTLFAFAGLVPPSAFGFVRSLLSRLLLPGLLLALAAGAIAWAGGQGVLAARIWAGTTALVLALLAIHILSSLRRGEFGLDLIAALAMGAALVFGENLAGAIVALMFTGGQALEAYAQRRAALEMSALLARVPRTAARYENGRLADVPLDALRPGDCLLVRRGEVVPVDGTLDSPLATLDQAALTGEPLPVRRAQGEAVMSGTTNAGNAFNLTAIHAAADSTYAGIVRLVEAAQRSKAPMVRLADRYALGFLVLTLAIAGAAWALSGDPVRLLAVLVIATPCPLILAVPVAIISGMSRCAGRGVLVKDGGALERLARLRTVLIDKTGTLTGGRPRLIAITAGTGFAPDDALRLAASLDQASAHVVASALVEAAGERGLALTSPSDINEEPGAGLTGRVGAHRVAVGGRGFVAAHLTGNGGNSETDGAAFPPGTVSVDVAVDGVLAGTLLLADAVREEAQAVLAALRDMGVTRLILATGDETARAQAIAAGLGFDAVLSNMTPQDKAAAVVAERANGPVMMIGDGVNDAPALAAADIGVAMGGGGSGGRSSAASSEAASVVILVDRLDRLIDAMAIARRSRAIAVQSVVAGIGLSTLGMVAAAFGLLAPVEGALLQELIDVAVILNALRALRAPPAGAARQGAARQGLRACPFRSARCCPAVGQR
ncbi:P-type E1-E2 ATPase/heavy metal translocating P-type ATPase [Ancylobacter aquaticus]|uniref:P-type Zn(2+) transporter n=1 Tax=Ancylobacter aquaticus TaxID=100 RepID=A0A4R1I9U7_ANCAQ|nr:P-type E1-E2 ATPase/heavy metal translocating P-type ATPase [Ancylobacter aquaticus]